MASTAAVVLAAGRGTRMRSTRAKVLHEVAGLPLVTWVCRAARPLVDRVVVVVGHERDAVRSALASEDVDFAVQEVPEGTGHALACAAPMLEGAERLVVLAGDAPLVRTSTLEELLGQHERLGAAATVLTFLARDPSGYGRVVRTPAGTVRAIVEEKDASAEQRAIHEVNSSSYAFRSGAVLPLLARLPRRGTGERYLTDVVAMMVETGLTVAACEAPELEAMGVNTLEHLATADEAMRARR